MDAVAHIHSVPASYHACCPWPAPDNAKPLQHCTCTVIVSHSTFSNAGHDCADLCVSIPHALAMLQMSDYACCSREAQWLNRVASQRLIMLPHAQLRLSNYRCCLHSQNGTLISRTSTAWWIQKGGGSKEMETSVQYICTSRLLSRLTSSGCRRRQEHQTILGGRMYVFPVPSRCCRHCSHRFAMSATDVPQHAQEPRCRLTVYTHQAQKTGPQSLTVP